jgi:hypothetical protein
MTPPRYLGNEAAQTALNCPVWLGSLQSIKGTTAVTPDPLTKTGTIKSIYRFDQNETDEKKYWFHWTTDVDVVQGFIAGDTSERTYYTGDGVPKVTNSTLALTGGGTLYPIASYTLGVPKPTVALTTAKAGTPDLSTPAETRVYTFTYVNSWDEESEPYSATSMAGSTETIYTGETITVTLPTAPTGSYNVTKKRIYRSASGTSDTSFFFVAEVAVAVTTYVDNIAGDALNEVIPSLTWVHPDAGMQGLVGMPNGVMAGFKGNDIYLSEPYRPFAWPVQYMQTVGYPVVGLAVVDTTLVIMTKGRPYFIQGSHPDAMVMIEADVSQSCISKKSIVVMNKHVFYASPDGLVGLSAGGSSVVTESMFDKEAWQDMGPSGLIGQRHEDQYIGFLPSAPGSNKGFVYDMKAKTWNFHSVVATGGYNDLRHDTLYLIIGNELSKWNTGTNLSYTWKSKKFTFPEPKSFSCYRVQAETYPVTIKIYRDGVSIVNISVTDGTLSRLPPGLGTDWEFQVEGDKEVYNVQLAQSPMELNQG